MIAGVKKYSIQMMPILVGMETSKDHMPFKALMFGLHRDMILQANL
jgi:hypothetical protein